MSILIIKQGPGIQTAQSGIIASAVQTQAGATSLTKNINRIDTVVTTADTARIDVLCVPGVTVLIQNYSTNSADIYASTVVAAATFNINGTPQANTVPFSLAGGGNELLVYCYTAGEWSTQ